MVNHIRDNNNSNVMNLKEFQTPYKVNNGPQLNSNNYYRTDNGNENDNNNENNKRDNDNSAAPPSALNNGKPLSDSSNNLTTSFKLRFSFNGKSRDVELDPLIPIET